MLKDLYKKIILRFLKKSAKIIWWLNINRYLCSEIIYLW